MKNKVLPMACCLLLLQFTVTAQDASKTTGSKSATKLSPKAAKVNSVKKLPSGAHLRPVTQDQKK